MRIASTFFICFVCVIPAFAVVATAPAVLETDPVSSADDAADDACFWVHPSDPEKSIIIGTNKDAGLVVYGLDGKQVQFLQDGKMNNVDVRYGFTLGHSAVDIVIASNRSDDTLAVYSVDAASGTLKAAGSIKTKMKLVYGLCMYRSASDGNYYVFVTSEDGEVEQWKLKESPNVKVDGELVRSIKVGDKTEGCVADDDAGVVFFAEEEMGIWCYGAEPNAGTERRKIDGMKPEGHLTADVEGLAIYYGPDKKGYLLASSQGDSTFTVYEREGKNAYLGSFQIAAAGEIDAVTGSDGIDVLNTSFGTRFAKGAFITQDDENDSGNQNFKLVQWESIAGAMTPPLMVEPSRSPRH